MKKSEFKRMQRGEARAAARAKKASAVKQLHTATANLQTLLWLAAHLNGGSIKIPHAKVKDIELKACRLDVVTAPEGEEPGYIVKAEFNLKQ